MDNQIDIYNQPPVNANEIVTDEDLGEDDYTSIHNLPGKQLIAPAELPQLSLEIQEGEESIVDTGTEENNEPLGKKIRSKPVKSHTKKPAKLSKSKKKTPT